MRGAAICLAASALLFSIPISAAEPPGKAMSIPVQVAVTAEDVLKSKVLGYLKGELAQLPNVTLAEQGAAVTLDVIVTEFRMSDGRLTGYMVYSGGYQPGPACSRGSKAGEPQAVVIQWQSLRMVPPDLQAACHRTVTEFKDEVVDPMVHEMKRVEDSFKPKGAQP